MIKFTKKQRIFSNKKVLEGVEHCFANFRKFLFKFCIENDPKGQEPLFHCFNLVHSKNNTRFNMGAYLFIGMHVQTSELLCMDHPPIRVVIHRSSYVWLPRYAPMVIDVGFFLAAEVPTKWSDYTLPFNITYITWVKF